MFYVSLCKVCKHMLFLFLFSIRHLLYFSVSLTCFKCYVFIRNSCLNKILSQFSSCSISFCFLYQIYYIHTLYFVCSFLSSLLLISRSLHCFNSSQFHTKHDQYLLPSGHQVCIIRKDKLNRNRITLSLILILLSKLWIVYIDR